MLAIFVLAVSTLALLPVDNAFASHGLTITKTPDAASISAGGQIGYTITVENRGQATETKVQLIDRLPTAAGTAWSMSPAKAGCAINGGVLTCALGNMANKATFSVHVVSPTGAGSCGTINNSASVTAANPNSASVGPVPITVKCPTLSVTKAADASSVLMGGTIGFTITVANSTAAGTGIARSVLVSDPLPTGSGVSWTIDSQPAGNPCTITSGTMGCTLGDMAPGASTTMHITSSTDSTSVGTYPNTATATPSNGSSASANDFITVRRPISDLAVSVTTSHEGGTDKHLANFANVVTNNGPDTAPGGTLEIVITGTDLVAVFTSKALGDCIYTLRTATEFDISCPVSSLVSGASQDVFAAAATANPGSTVHETITIVEAVVDSNSANDSASATEVSG